MSAPRGIFVKLEQTNPRAHDRAPYSLRYGAGHADGRFDTIDQAVAAVSDPSRRPHVVTFDGAWIVGAVVESDEEIILSSLGSVGSRFYREDRIHRRDPEGIGS